MINGNNSYAQSIGTNMQNPEGVFLKEPVPAPDLIEKSITDNGDYSAKADGADGYSSVDVNVANSFTPADEGKVVDNGALVAQTAYPTEITENNTYDTTNYNSITVNVASSGGISGSYVTFYDYDGTVVAAYSEADFRKLTAMPDNPTHEGLTAQGWNWSLSDAKWHSEYEGKLNIGQMYITSDGKTRFYYVIQKEFPTLELHLTLDNNTELDIDWGDGTEHTTWTSGSSKIHTYANGGEYTVAITVVSGGFSISSSGDTDYTLKKVEFGSGVTSIGNNAFSECYGLSSITIPSNVTSIGSYAFYQCTGLSSIIIPSGITAINASTFYGCGALALISIPNELKTIGNDAFYYCGALSSIAIPTELRTIGINAFCYCKALSSIVIPSGVESIGDYAFSYCDALTSLTFARLEPPLLSGGEEDFGLRPTTVIYVPENGWEYYEEAIELNGYPDPDYYTYVLF